MKHSLKRLLLLLILFGSTAPGAPISFDEISFLVRMRETDASITSQVLQRRLLRMLAPEQEAALKKQGVSESLLHTLRDPKLAVDEAEALAFEKRGNERKATAITENNPPTVPRVVPAAAVTTAPKFEPVPTGVNAVIDRVRIILQPMPPPYYIYLEVESGRSEAVFEDRKTVHGSETMGSMALDIPINVVMKDIRLNSWASVTLHVDPDPDAAPSFRALKKHTARFQLLEGSHHEHFIPQLSASPFIYDLHYHTSR